MRILRLFLGTSRWPFVLAVLAGIVSGLTTTALLAIISYTTRFGKIGQPGIWGWFLAFCIVRLAAGIAAHGLLIHLSQNTLCKLRLRLCAQILHTPLASLEKLGSHRLLAAITEDLGQLTTTLINLPYLFVNLIIVAGCLTYLGYLSWRVLISISLAIGLGALSYGLAVVWASGGLVNSGRGVCRIRRSPRIGDCSRHGNRLRMRLSRSCGPREHLDAASISGIIRIDRNWFSLPKIEKSPISRRRCLKQESGES
jgi:putative ATP-binding cassette transporter